jgi:hypothetical protein
MRWRTRLLGWDAIIEPTGTMRFVTKAHDREAAFAAVCEWFKRPDGAFWATGEIKALGGSAFAGFFQ